MKTRSFLIGTLALLLCSVSAPSLACGYDGMAVDLATAHPASLPVALAIFDAYEARLLARPIPLQGGFGLRRAQVMLDKLRTALAPITKGDSFSLLLVEPGLWARFDGTGAELRMTLHVPAPAEGETTVITGEGVLQALVQGKLGVDQALQAGLIQVLAPALQTERLTSALLQAFPRPPLAVAAP
ncbi:hypothetical protein [Pseudomonas sp. BN102]|uniref:hypothetical protein n=1 Tax=Pseudomonas sp. BN102 TaxID=2567886 RepID=UPI00245810F4|nr:hypothetical protein [Pseudomonas sp. BN102]MDH4612457.1 hypothetical protein [Pseudomonas sp. BN102]